MPLFARLLNTLLVLAALSAPAPAEARSAASVYRSLPPHERMAVQEALVWTGHYDGEVDSRISSGTIQAIRRYQKTIGQRASGVLTPDQADGLIEAGGRARQAVGYAFHQDRDTGIAMGLPLGLAPQAGRGERGSRFASPDGRVEIELFRIPGEEGGLREVYRKVETGRPDRRVTYSRRKKDWFVLTGTEGSREFYMRARRDGRDVVAFAVVYDKSVAATLEPAIVAMSSSFARPQLAATAAVPGSAGPKYTEETVPPPQDHSPAGRQGEQSAPLPISAGFAVSPDGHILTTARVARCGKVAVSDFGEASLLASDQRNDLALLKVEGRTDDVMPGFAGGSVRVGQSVTAATPRAGVDAPAYVSIGEVRALSGPAGDTSRLQIAAPPRLDDGGAPLLDEAGGIVGILAAMMPDEVSDAALNPERGMRLALRKSVAEAFLSAHGIQPPETGVVAAPLEEADVAERARAVTHAVFCEDFADATVRR